jgi:FtsZ-binding cell division protein ZapB
VVKAKVEALEGKETKDALWATLFTAATDELKRLGKKEEQLRKEKEQLRKEKEQLRKKEEQLREEKNILLKQGSGVALVGWRCVGVVLCSPLVCCLSRLDLTCRTSLFRSC